MTTIECPGCGRKQEHEPDECQKCSNPDCDYCLECLEPGGWEDEQAAPKEKGERDG